MGMLNFKNVNLKNIKLTKGQQKILMATGIVIAAFFVFIYFIYIPQSRTLERLRREFVSVKREIADIEGQAGRGRSLGESVEALQRRLTRLEQRFPSKEEIVIRELPKYANELGIKVTNLRPDRKRKIEDIKGKGVAIAGYDIEAMNISMDIRCSYKALAEYLRVLKEDFPALVMVGHITMEKREENSPILNISLGMEVYLLSPSVGA